MLTLTLLLVTFSTFKLCKHMHGLCTNVRRAIASMFLHLVFVVALLKFGECQNQCVGDVQSLQNEMQSLTQLVVNNTALLQELLSNNLLGSFQNPASSCQKIPPGNPSGHYWIKSNSDADPIHQYCDMDRICCGSKGGWMRVANIDMTDPNQQCPLKFITEYVSSKRWCTGEHGPGCTPVMFHVHGVEYSRVCGRVIGYQKGSTNAFRARIQTIEGYYLDGISLTHGSSPRRHIWSFAAALDETRSTVSSCPCTRSGLNVSYTGKVPLFVGDDYFCDTGSRNHFAYNTYYDEDPLWDGQGCGEKSTCCSFNTPPWFCKQLLQPTSDDIEFRLCKDQVHDDENVYFEIVQLYIQ